MFTSTTSSEHHYSNSIGIRPLLPTKWKFNNNNIEVAPNCPRCASSNTKFCYYNNYSLSQPRYFCKGCRRYWTKGGSLRNVPVGGGCRKSRRSRRHPAPAGPSPAHGSPSNAGGACIDMAAVFAKYVNQNLENVDESSAFSPGASTGSSSDNVQASSTFDVDNDSQFEDINDNNNNNNNFNNNNNTSRFVGDDQMQQAAVPQMSTCHDVSGQQFVYGDCSGFELQLQQGVLCDELSPDILWSEGTTLPNLGFQQQPMVQVEDCGLFAADDYDQLRISANLVSDNWGSFDLSAYDFYSTP
ncbi:hypothetical protein C2S53_004045 [Perilla frutescens var. hirtella]|uniref:Dof zinc finger protein n=1 Tax=Perilla frutescens var. hirtella TaxID=608512 RepID=A0AAD4P2C8_PERFH|nr:hypothetical protein C2S53_004045 [Perilla frutescens var. hirtella]